MNGELSNRPPWRRPSWWERFKRWWSYIKWEAVLAISKVMLALVTLGLFLGAIKAYLASVDAYHESIHTLQKDATYQYLEMWNSPYMLKQRQILAHALLPEFPKIRAAVQKNPQEWPSDYLCHHMETLQKRDLSPLYQGPEPELKPSTFSAFESVRTFFEQLGAAYHAGDFNDHDAFETFSLPAEAYWTAAVSGWLREHLPEHKNDPQSFNSRSDKTLGTEFRDFECGVEQDEAKDGAHPVPLDEIEWILKQDDNLPNPAVTDPPSTSSPVASRPTSASEAFGPRIPIEYFVTKGVGESDEGIPPDPYETFSYDIALKQAAIEDFNVVPYTSVLPPEANEVPLDDVKPTFHHGAVLEVIMAKQGGIRNHTVCAGVGRAWATDPAGKEVGGYAAEYEYAYDRQVSIAAGEQDATKQLTRSLNHELAIRGFKQTRQMTFTVACLPIHKKYGMAIAAFGFVKFIFPKVEADPSRGVER